MWISVSCLLLFLFHLLVRTFISESTQSFSSCCSCLPFLSSSGHTAKLLHTGKGSHSYGSHSCDLLPPLVMFCSCCTASCVAMFHSWFWRALTNTFARQSSHTASFCIACLCCEALTTFASIHHVSVCVCGCVRVRFHKRFLVQLSLCKLHNDAFTLQTIYNLHNGVPFTQS